MAKHQRLRVQMSLSMILTAIIALLIFISGMTAFYMQIRASWLSHLSEENRLALEQLMAREEVSSEAVTALVGAFSYSWDSRYGWGEITYVVILSIAAIAISTGIGIWVASRISKPIESITEAAIDVSKGDYKFSADRTLFRSRESQNLHDAFERMTRSLEQADRELTASAAAIAHELRTPLTVLQGRLMGFKDGAFESNDQNISALLRQVETLVSIVKDLKILGGVADRQQFEIEKQDLEVIVSAVVMASRPDLEALSFEIVVNTTSVEANVDSSRVTQVLNSLVENAARYAQSGNYIEFCLTKDGETALLIIRDKGPGLSNDEKKQVFDRWWRADASRNRQSGGSGLGLSVVKAIVEAQNGEIIVCDPSDGIGVQFEIRFPT